MGIDGSVAMALGTVLLAVGPGDADRIDRLAEETIDIAGPSDATVVLGHVFTDEEYAESLDRLGFDTTSGEVSPDDVASRHATIRELIGQLDEASVEHAVGGAIGGHGDSIVGLAEKADADLVIVGGRQRSPAGKAVFGSTAQEVMLSAPCPVTFVRADTS
ncbi:universal stress protein uspa-like protein [Halococcus salifodinae DSM 8989]|uniref:Universal stress protein uspa-like protein n=2 Tax=Halococcus salifodinae TaxID=36738 RepID=M0MSU7_9EURY|nr:universal stress protein uspa-like protein [Halococcus salifodinae DSM 8989]